ncbi:MAG: hypothetical protein H0X71_03910 [Rubrobacter sp.]|nr:hypothetical protein [Rubrobacter sp.]
MLSVVVTVAVLAFVVVLLIQVVYDVLWGPDPARFGFWTNLFHDGILTTVHLVVATGIIRIAIALRARTPRPSNG